MRHIMHTGLIPARAGNTGGQFPRRQTGRAHPRSRGEHHLMQALRLLVPGSSPLARGTHGLYNWLAEVGGLIPARAGNTVLPEPGHWFAGAHPRSRGEHPKRTSICSSDTGSSPLARGTPPERTFSFNLTGLIPARAGNTSRWLRVGVFLGAHPRSRGEHKMACVKIMRRPGSSPLARGTPKHRI